MRDDEWTPEPVPIEKMERSPLAEINGGSSFWRSILRWGKQALGFAGWFVPLNFIVLALVTAFRLHSLDIVAIGVPKSLAEESIRRDLTEAAEHFSRGLDLYDQKKLDEAAAEYREAIRLDPTLAAPHYKLGNVLRDQNKLDDATAEYREAIRLDPTDAIMHYNLGLVLYDQKKLDEAAAEYREAIRLAPTAPAIVHYVLGLVLYEQKKLDEAAGEYREAIRLDPTDTTLHYNLGNVLLDLAMQSTDAAATRQRRLEACAEFIAGATLSPTAPDYGARINDVDMLLSPSDHCRL